jgi:hypothetical protein
MTCVISSGSTTSAGSTSTDGSSLQQQQPANSDVRHYVRNKHKVVTTFAPTLAARQQTAAACDSSTQNKRCKSTSNTNW